MFFELAWCLPVQRKGQSFRVREGVWESNFSKILVPHSSLLCSPRFSFTPEHAEWNSAWFSGFLTAGKGFGFLESVKSVTTDFPVFQNFAAIVHSPPVMVLVGL